MRSMGHSRNCRPPSSCSLFLLVEWNREQSPLRQRRKAKLGFNAAIVIKPHLPRLPRVPMATQGFVCPPIPPPPVLRTGSRARRGLVGRGCERRRSVCPGRRGCGGSRARGRRRAGQGSCRGAGRGGAARQRPASFGVSGVRGEGRGGRAAAAACRTSGVRRTPGARVLAVMSSPPPPTGFVLFRGSIGSRRVLGVAQASMGSGGSRARPSGICSHAGAGRKYQSWVVGVLWGLCGPSQWLLGRGHRPELLGLVGLGAVRREVVEDQDPARCSTAFLLVPRAWCSTK